ncbi:hypothetical protein RJT34_05819 [Clitoria ternatea]|uniref:Uncharacterized protein n=1 Tax=Clitoria ternatea TaxID=43366 RepID=A0AAN9K4Y3_CLITE
MGVCASSPHSSSSFIPKTTTESSVRKGAAPRASESFRRPSSIMVMDMLGGIKEFKQPIPASAVLSENPNCFLCNSESMYIGTCMPRLPDHDHLLPGRIYFLVPLSLSHSPLSLTLLCDLAVKASSALQNPNNSNNNNNKPSLPRRTI